tara:strand:+ start:787 stop:1110 length:324 start_codon:yes stop_codon:yes gene_type:complete
MKNPLPTFKKLTVIDQNANLYNLVINADTREIIAPSQLELINEVHAGTFDLDEIGDNSYVRALMRMADLETSYSIDEIHNKDVANESLEESLACVVANKSLKESLEG